MECKYYTVSEIIADLEKGCFEKFEFFDDGTACTTDTTEYYEIRIETENGTVSEESRKLALEVLKNLDRHTARARLWLRNFNVKHDKWNPDGLDAGFAIDGIFIGCYETGGNYQPKYYGFMLTFRTVNYYPCEFYVKFNCNLNPFAAEICVE